VSSATYFQRNLDTESLFLIVVFSAMRDLSFVLLSFDASFTISNCISS
jgi:hypothetical protein